MWNNPRARAAVDYGETDRGDVREKTVVGNACGGKLLELGFARPVGIRHIDGSGVVGGSVNRFRQREHCGHSPGDGPGT